MGPSVRREPKSYEDARPGDRVLFLMRQGPVWVPKKGRVVMRGPAGLVLNIGGRWGTPAVCGPGQFLEVL